MLKKLKIIVYTLAVYLLFTVSANAQTECPSGMVCITPQAARKALADSDTVIAQSKEILTLREAVLSQREVTVDIKIEFAKCTGEKNGAQQEVIRQAAYIELLMKYGRVKKFGLINF